jgi:hypothetical protein
MKVQDLNTTGPVWTFTPASHKTEHHGRGRVIYLGPKAQEVLKPFLRPELIAYLFSPTEALAERQADRRRNRKTSLSGSLDGSSTFAAVSGSLSFIAAIPFSDRRRFETCVQTKRNSYMRRTDDPSNRDWGFSLVRIAKYRSSALSKRRVYFRSTQ